MPALVLGLIIAVVDMAAFGEFWYVRAVRLPASSRRRAVLLGAGRRYFSLAALLMLTQRSLKRLLVLSTVEDIGFLLLGIFSFNVARSSEAQ